MKSITRTQFVQMLIDTKGVTFGGLTYHCDESKSRTKGGKKMLQKVVDTTATMNSVYQSKINRILEKNEIVVDWTPNEIKGRQYIDGTNRCLIESKKTGEAQLAFVVETHTKTTSQLFLNGQPVERADVWNETYIMPSGLIAKDEDAVKNSMFNHITKAANEAREEGNEELAARLDKQANEVANCAEFQKLEFYFRTLSLDNILTARLGGENYLLTGKAPLASEVEQMAKAGAK